MSSLFTLLAWLVCLYFIGLPWTWACVCSLLQGSHSFLVKSSVECSECKFADQIDTIYFRITLQQLEAANWHLATFDELNEMKSQVRTLGHDKMFRCPLDSKDRFNLTSILQNKKQMGSGISENVIRTRRRGKRQRKRLTSVNEVV